MWTSNHFDIFMTTSALLVRVSCSVQRQASLSLHFLRWKCEGLIIKLLEHDLPEAMVQIKGGSPQWTWQNLCSPSDQLHAAVSNRSKVESAAWRAAAQKHTESHSDSQRKWRLWLKIKREQHTGLRRTRESLRSQCHYSSNEGFTLWVHQWMQWMFILQTDICAGRQEAPPRLSEKWALFFFWCCSTYLLWDWQFVLSITTSVISCIHF